jgi:hypothetical protein
MGSGSRLGGCNATGRWDETLTKFGASAIFSIDFSQCNLGALFQTPDSQREGRRDVRVATNMNGT